MEESQFYSQLGQLNDQIAEMLLSIKPEEWTDIIYSVEVNENKSNTSTKEKIINSKNESLLVCPPDQLGELIGAKMRLFREYKNVWKEFHMHVFLEADSKSWQYKLDYQYE